MYILTPTNLILGISAQASNPSGIAPRFTVVEKEKIATAGADTGVASGEVSYKKLIHPNSDTFK